MSKSYDKFDEAIKEVKDALITKEELYEICIKKKIKTTLHECDDVVSNLVQCIGCEGIYLYEDGLYVSQCQESHFYCNNCAFRCVNFDKLDPLCEECPECAGVTELSCGCELCDSCAYIGTHKCPLEHKRQKD